MAIKNDGMIYRASTMMGDGGIYGAVKPTNTYDACLLVVLSGGKAKKSCRNWNPTADDLIANDWEIVKEQILMQNQR